MSKAKKNRYRYKLNMLEPGIVMCRIMLTFSALSVLLFLFHFYHVAMFFLCFAVLIFLIMLLLILIEQHQDHMLYLDAKKNDPDIK